MKIEWTDEGKSHALQQVLTGEEYRYYLREIEPDKDTNRHTWIRSRNITSRITNTRFGPTMELINLYLVEETIQSLRYTEVLLAHIYLT